jgi:hypothetical protein
MLLPYPGKIEWHITYFWMIIFMCIISVKEIPLVFFFFMLWNFFNFCIKGFHSDVPIYVFNILWSNSYPLLTLTYLSPHFKQFNSSHYSVFIQVYKALWSYSPFPSPSHFTSPLPLVPTPKQNQFYTPDIHFFLYSYIHMCIHCLGHFSPLPLPSPPAPHLFLAEPVLPFFPILLTRIHKQW